jgi:class 3 adenylate cyclase/tetratricopeptide (TPR) repeat protein
MSNGTVRRLSAILAADVVGYSRMMGEDEARTLSALRRLRDETLAPAVAANGGRIVKGLGDGWLVAFDSSAAAVLCAVSVQDSLGDGAPMRLRIGIHIGDVAFEDGDIFGDGVNVAARLEAIAAPGGLAISETVWSSLDGTIRSRFTDCGPRQLKNIASPVRVWARGGLPEPSAPAPAGEAGPSSIAIVPFLTSTGDADHQALALGIVEDLTTELSRFRWLDVLRPEDEARARYVLGGAVRGSGQRVRLTAHLTYASTGRQFWSERWDRTLDDIFAVQDELAVAVVACVSPEIDAHEKSLIGARPVQALTADELGLRANAILAAGELDGFDRAEALVARAVTLEPENPQVHTQKALIAYRKACSGAWPPREQLQVALDAARHALRFDPRMASAYGIVSVVHGMLGETDRALDAADRIASLNPNAWGAPHGGSVALSFAPADWVAAPQAHAAELIDQAEATLRLAPRSAYRSGHLFSKGLGLLLRDQEADLTDAVGALDRSATEPGASWWPSLFAALAELRRGRDLQARERIREVRERHAGLSLQAVDALFGRAFLAARWRDTFDRLPAIGLPHS